MQTNEPAGASGPTRAGLSTVSGPNIRTVFQASIVGAWVTVPFAVAMATSKEAGNTSFLVTLGILAFFSFAFYALWFGFAEALLVGLIFITNSAFSDPAYLPRVSLGGGNLFLCDYYLILAGIVTLLMGRSGPQRFFGSYRRYFFTFAFAIGVSVCVGLARHSDTHYMLRELHPLVYYPLVYVIAIRTLDTEERWSRVLVATVGIVFVSCAATFWQLFMSSQFQFMTSATPVFGLAQGEEFNAQSLRPPSAWLFLVFLLVTLATYSCWKKHRLLIGGVLLADTLCILVGYSRSVFVAIIGALLFLGLIRKRRILPFLWSVTKWTTVAATMLIVLYWAVNAAAPGYTEAFESRIIGSLGTSITDTDEPFLLGARLYEVQMAITHIIEHPLLGLGAGAEYRDILPFEYSQGEVQENPDDGRYYMHNSYLFVWMKYGLFGALAAVWIVWHFVQQTWVLARQPGGQALLPQGMLIAFAGLAIANVTAPAFVASAPTPILVGLMAGFIEVRNRSQLAMQAEPKPRTL
jgi:hypothetical protein